MTNADEVGDADTWHGTAQISIDGSPTQVIRIEGDIDLANASDIDRRIRLAYESEIDQVVVDLGAVTYLDSAGLAMLVRIASRLASARTKMTVLAPADSVASRVIALSGLAEELGLRNDSAST